METPSTKGKSSPVTQAWGQAKRGDLGVTTEVQAGGEIIQGDGDEKTQDKVLGKDGMKRRGKGRRGTCKGKGGERGRSAGECTCSDLLLSDPRQDTAPSLPRTGILTPPHRLESPCLLY